MRQPTPNYIRDLEMQYGPFRRMHGNDLAIWSQYLMQGGNRLAPFEYDVPVGHGVRMPPDATAMQLKVAADLTTKRIDVLAKRPTMTVIIEVKYRAGASAVGQLLTYGQLYRQDNPDAPPIVLLLVTDELQPDMREVFSNNGIFVQIVGEPTLDI